MFRLCSLCSASWISKFAEPWRLRPWSRTSFSTWLAEALAGMGATGWPVEDIANPSHRGYETPRASSYSRSSLRENRHFAVLRAVV